MLYTFNSTQQNFLDTYYVLGTYFCKVLEITKNIKQTGSLTLKSLQFNREVR